MEIFRQHGMAEAIAADAGTMRYISKVQWSSSLGGSGPFDRRQIGSVNAFGGGEESDQAATYQ